MLTRFLNHFYDVFSENVFLKSRLAWNFAAFISWFKENLQSAFETVITVNACNAEEQLDHSAPWALYAYTRAKYHKPLWIIEVFRDCYVFTHLHLTFPENYNYQLIADQFSVEYLLR